MAEYRPPLFQAMDWLSQRNAQNNQYYKNAPPVGMNMTPQQLRYAMPPMRDSQVEPYIDRVAQEGRAGYTAPSAEEIMKQLMAVSPAKGTVPEARNQEIATANSTTNNPYLLNPQSGAAAMSDPNAMTPALVNGRAPGAPAGGGGGARGGGQMYGPTMADMPNGGQPTYYYMDPGDGGIVRTILSQNGMPPSMSGYTQAGSQLAPQDQGILAKLLRGAF